MKDSSKNKDEFCVKCGTCNTVCPVYQATGNEIHTPRGKQHLASRMQQGHQSAHYADIFSKCLLCGACLEACPRELDTPQLVMDVRAGLPKISGISFLKYISRKALVHPTLFSGLTRVGAAAHALLGEVLPEESGLRLRLAGIAQQEALGLPGESYMAKIKSGAADSGERLQSGSQGQAEVNYFTGCLANHLQPEIAESTQFLLSGTTGRRADVPLTQTCCGMAALAAGRKEEALKLARRNIRAFENDDKPILTSCSSCYFQLQGYKELFADDPQWRERASRFTEKLREFSTFFLEKFSEKRLEELSGAKDSPVKIYYHDPCHLRFKLHITREPRQLLKLFPGILLGEFPNGPKCCGHGGLFQIAHPDLAHQIGERAMEGCGDGAVVTACSGCLLQWQIGLGTAGGGAQAMHLAVLLAGRMR
jgi:glycolate oxidase iron-sulfur subunit